MCVANVARIAMGHAGVLQQEQGTVQWLSMKSETRVFGDEIGSFRTLFFSKESKYADLVSFSLSVLF